jgi:hypothetical protein
MRSLVLLLAKLVRTIKTNRLSFLTGSFHLLVKFPFFVLGNEHVTITRPKINPQYSCWTEPSSSIHLTVAISSLVTVAVPITIQIYRGEGPGRVLVYSATETYQLSVH